MYQDSILEFEVLRDKVTIVSFENRKVFRRMVTELDIQCDSGVGPWILNDNDKAFNLDKYSHIILNPLYVDVNSKSLLTKLQNQLTKEALLMTEEVADIVNRLHAFYYSLEFGYPLSIQHKMEMGAAEIIKLGSFNFEFNRKGDVMDVNDTLRMYKNDDIRMYNSDCITDTIVEVITTCNTYTLLTVHLL